MKKVLVVLLAGVMLFSLSACGFGGIKLEEDQMHIEFDSDEGVTLTICADEDDVEDDFDCDKDDSTKEIMEDIQDELDDYYDDVEVTSVKKSKDLITITLYAEDLEDMYYEFESLEDYVDDYYYDDIDDFAEYNEFVYYKNEDDVDEDDLEDYEDFFIMDVYGDDEGTYFTFPKNIELVSEDMDFEKIDSKTIFVEDDEYGYVIFED